MLKVGKLPERRTGIPNKDVQSVDDAWESSQEWDLDKARELYGSPAPKVSNGTGRVKTAVSNLVGGTGQVLSMLPKQLAMNDSRIRGGLRERAQEESANDNEVDIVFGEKIKQLEEIDPRELTAYKAGEKMDEFFTDLISRNEAYADDFWTSKVPNAFGQMVGFMLTGGAIRGGVQKLSGRKLADGWKGDMVATAVPGMGLGGVIGFEDALDSGASLEDAFESSSWNAAVGATEGVPIANMMVRADKLTGGGIKNGIKKALTSGTEEAIQEAFGQVMQNLIASNVVEYDPERNTWNGVEEGAKVGFTTGALMQTLLSLVGGRRSGGGQEQANPDPENITPDKAEIEKEAVEASTVFDASDTNPDSAETALEQAYTAEAEESIDITGSQPTRSAIPDLRVSEPAQASESAEQDQAIQADTPTPNSEQAQPSDTDPEQANPLNEEMAQPVAEDPSMQPEAVQPDAMPDQQPVEPVQEMVQDPAQEVEPAAPIKTGLQGATDTAFTPDNKPVDVQYEIIDAADLIASNDENGNVNPDFPQSLQPRDRTGKKSQTQINSMASSINPDRLGVTNSVTDGAPIVGDVDNVIESGNGRVSAIRKAYKQGDKKYRQWLIDNADSFGVTADEIGKIKQPVLVRRRRTPMDERQRMQFAIDANRSTVANMSALESAKTDSALITDDLISQYQPSQDGNVLAASNSQFLRLFSQAIGSTDTAGLMTGDGRWTKQMSDRVQAAVFHKAYGNDRLTELLAQEADPTIKNILNALNVAAPYFARIKTEAQAIDIDVPGMISEATAIVLQAKNSNISVADLVKQAGLFGDLNPEAAMMAEFMDAFSRSAKRIGEMFVETAQQVEREIQAASTGDMFDRQPSTINDILSRAAATVEANNERQQQSTDLFSQAANTNAEPDISGGSGESQQAGSGRTETGVDAVSSAEGQQDQVTEYDNAAPENFTPTHELPNGDQVMAVEGETNLYIDADGIEIEDNNATPIETNQRRQAALRDSIEQSDDKDKIIAELRRANEATQKRLYTSPITDTPNRLAYEDADKKTYVASIDVDALKWVNDNMGHQSGDALLKEVGQALQSAGLEVYHFSGDEFVAQSNNKADLDKTVAQALAALGDINIEAELPDGTVITTTQAGFSYGIGKTLNEAENGLRADKAGREKKGLRSTRGREPAGVVRTPAEGSQDQGGEVQLDGQSKPDQEIQDVDNEQESTDILPDNTTQESNQSRNDPPIEDFGQKIEGARKDFASKMAEAKEKDIASVPLSESWPQPDYQKLIASGFDPIAVGFARAVREEVPSKPRRFDVKGWVEKVSMLRDMAERVISGETDMDTIRRVMAKSSSGKSVEKILGRGELYAEFGHEKSLKGIKFYEAFFSMLRTGDKLEKDVTKWVIERPAGASNPFSNMPYTIASADTKQEAIEKFRKVYAGLDNKKKAKSVRFDIYTSRRDQSDVFIGKKIGSDTVRIEQGFKTVAEARGYMAKNQDALEQKLDRLKDVPAMRRETNNPRIGIDHRNGGDVSPEQFGEAFGFRGVQFGNYVEQGRRQDDLNDAYDALMDMAGILNVPPKALSLNGELGLAFGARGKGGKRPAAAHYEAGNIVINLTKKSGAGSLAHEWWHSLDNYFSRKGGVARKFVTDNPYRKLDGVRPEMIAAFKEINAAVNRTMLRQRSERLDATRTKPYWATDIEMSARSFESYVIEKLRDQGVSNDYLANIVGEDYWNAAAKLGIEKDGTYPYPEAAEVLEIRGAFDNFFNVVETRETDAGTELYSFAGQQSNTADRLQLDRALAMEADGRDRDMIRKETGWFRGEDGKLRYEISDDKAALDEIAGTSERMEVPLIAALNHPALFEAYPDLQSITVFQRPKPAGETYRGVFYEQDNLIELDSELTDKEKLSVLLHEVQHAIQARENFARGGNADARFTDSVRQTVSRMSDMERMRIDVWKGANDDLIAEADQAAEMARYALMYESASRLIDHSNRDRPSSQLRNLRNEMQWVYQYGYNGDQNAKDIEREWYALPKRHKMRERNEFLRDIAMRGANYLRDKIPSDVRKQFKNDPRQLKSMIKALQREAAAANQQLQPLRDQEKRMRSADSLKVATEFKSPHDIYRALAGEIEARNVQARQSMTEQERQDVSPERTRDVPRGEAIIVFGGLEMAVPMASQSESASLSVTQATETLSRDRLLKRAIDSGKLKVVQGADDLPTGSDLFETISAKTPEFYRGSGLNFTAQSDNLRGSNKNLKTGRDLVKYRKQNSLQSNGSGAIQGAYKDGTAYIVADGNTDSTLKQTAWHELTHATLDTNGDTFIQPAQKEKLFKRLDAQVKAARYIKGDSALKRAIARTEQAGTSKEKYLEEIAGYLVTDYVNDPSTLTGTIRQWVQDFIGAIQAAVLRYSGVQIGKVTGAELNAIARAYADYVTLPNRGRITEGGEALASKGEQAETKEFKEWFGYDWQNETERQNQGVVGRNASADTGTVSQAGQSRRSEGMGRDGRYGEEYQQAIKEIWNGGLDPETGNPRVWYHGTSDEFTAFDLDNPKRKDHGWLGTGVYLTTSESLARSYANTKTGSADPLVMPLYSSVRNPYFATPADKQKLRYGTRGDADRITKSLKDDGYDGIAVMFPDGTVELVAFDTSAVKSATSNNGNFDPDSDNILFSMAPSAEIMGPSNFAAPEETLVRTVIRKMQDKFKVLKDLQANIKESGGTINESNDAYRAEELFHGKAENDIRLMKEQFVEPMANMMAKFDIDQDALDQYLIAKHAPERNKQIAKINPAMPDGGSGMTNAEAKSLIADIESNGKLDQYEQTAGLIYELLQTQRDMIRSAGLESDGLLDTWEESYQFYVPLKGWKDETESEGMPISGSGFNIGGRESRRAMGRSSEAASPSSFAISDTTRVIIRKRKNEVGNALLKMIEDNPNKDYWQIYTEDKPETDRRIVRVKDPETGAMVDQVRETAIPMALMSDRYFTTKKDGQTYYMKLEDPRLMTAMKNLGPETIGVVIRTLGGINRILSALNTSYSPEFVISNFSRDVQTAILNLSAEQSLNPGDGKAAGEKIAAKTVKNVPTAMRAIYASLRGKKLKGGAAQWQQWFDEFRSDGAKTGYFDMKDLAGQAKELQTLIAMSQGGVKGNTIKFFKFSADFIEDLNQSVENAVRLSAYVNARQVGISRSQASSLAKNMTVNFNRRGEIGTLLNSLYMFANASIQGTANFARTMATLKGDKSLKWQNLNNAQKIAFGIMAGSYFMAMANRMVAGEDDDDENWYDKIPDYVKERNLVIMKSMFGDEANGEYWKIPLPYGYNIFAVAGVSAEAITMGDKSPVEASGELTLAALGSFSPIGFQESTTIHGTFLKNAAPTVIKPIVDVSLNENFMGSSIYSENLPFGTPKPESSLARRSTPLVYRELAAWMNEVTGGSEFRSGAIDVNPDVFNYFLDYFGGSAFQFFGTKTPEFGIRTFAGIEFDENRTPFLSRISGRVMHYEDTDKFYQRRNELNQVMTEQRSLRGGERTMFTNEYKDKLKLIPRMKYAEDRLKALRKQRDSIYQQDLTLKERDEKLKQIEKKMKSAVDDFNRSYNKTE